MRRQYITSIDLGTSAIRCVIAEYDDDEKIRILGVGSVPSEGLRRGAVVDGSAVSQSIRSALDKAILMSGVPVKSAIVGIGGCDISVQEAKGVVAVGRANNEVTEDDLNRAITAAQSVVVPNNKDIILVIPKNYRLDDQDNITDPIGLKGVRLEVNAQIIEASSTNIKNITSAMERAGVAVEKFVPEPLATAEAVLSKRQKELGVAVISLGASTTSLTVFEEGELLHTAVLPIGADFITHDLAIGMRTSIDVAEKVKISYGSAVYNTVRRNDEIDLSVFDSHEESSVLHDHVIEIIIARLDEIFKLVRDELKKIGKDGLLPAGVVLTGGGSNLVHITDYVKEYLQLPVQIGKVSGIFGIMDHVDDPSFSTSIGLIMWHINEDDKMVGGDFALSSMFGGVSEKVSGLASNVKDIFGKFLP